MKVWMRTVNRASGLTMHTEEIPVPNSDDVSAMVNAAIRALPATERIEWGMIADDLVIRPIRIPASTREATARAQERKPARQR